MKFSEQYKGIVGLIILVAIGLFTRLGSLAACCVLGMAFITQYGQNFAKWIYPVEVGVGFLMIFIGGPGKYSIDYMIAGKR